jgi:hypothetical protein
MMTRAGAWLLRQFLDCLDAADGVFLETVILLVAAVVVLAAGLFATGIWSWS